MALNSCGLVWLLSHHSASGVQVLTHTRQVEREQAEAAEKARLHNASFWIEKFMTSAVRANDPEVAGHHNSATPLAAVSAARWRKTLSDVQREAAAAAAAAAAEEEARAAEARARTEGAPPPPCLLPALLPSCVCLCAYLSFASLHLPHRTLPLW